MRSNLNILRKDAPRPEIPVRPAILAFLEATRRERTTMTNRGYRQRLLVFADYCEERGIGLPSVNGRVVNDFVEHLEKTHPPKKPGAATMSKTTLHGYVIAMKVWLHWCADDQEVYAEFVDRDETRRIKLPKLDHVIVEPFSDTQVRAMLSACQYEESEHMRARAKAIVHVLWGTGIRAAELCNLRLRDVHLVEGEDPYIKIVQGKGRKDRRIPLGPITRRKLSHYVETYRADQPITAPVFPNHARTEPLSISGLEQLIERLGRHALIEGVRVSPHTFRHTFACNCMKSGMDIYTLQRLLGHTNTTTTERYLRSLGGDFDLADLVRGLMR